MSNVLRLAIVDPDDDSREALKSLLLGMDLVWLEAECSRYEFFADVVGQTHPDIGVVCIDHDQEKALTLIEQLRDNSPEVSILVVSGSNDGQLILRSMRAGAKEFLTRPIRGEDLVAAMERIGSHRLKDPDGKSRSKAVIAVAGATGRVGTTSLAVNLACVLAADERKTVALADLDLSLGDADVFLDTIPDYTLVDVAQNISRLDFSLLKRSLTKHSSGLYLMPRPVQLQDMKLITPDAMNRVFGLLQATFSHMIIDLSKAYTEIDVVALQSATHVVLVTQLDLPCLRNVVRLLMSFEEFGDIKEKVRVVVNRVGLDHGQISLKKAQETIGCDIFWQIPNDYRTMVDVRNNGIPLIEQSPKAAITQSVVVLAEALQNGSDEVESAAEPDAAGRKSSWLNFWPARKTK